MITLLLGLAVLAAVIAGHVRLAAADQLRLAASPHLSFRARAPPAA